MTDTAVDKHSLAGRTAVVTGGLSGIGRASADALAGAGAKVAILDISADPSGRQLPNGELQIRANIADEGEIERGFDKIMATFGRVDILVNNAGVNVLKPAVEFTLADWNKVIGINLTGQFLCARRAGREMLAKGEGGRVINIASVLGHIGPIMHTAVAYSAAKSGLLGMTRALAVEWAPHRILVNAICPGMTATELTRKRIADDTYMSRVFARMPMREVSEPEDIADAVLYLASPAARMVTGHSLNVDGGWLAS